MSQNETETIKKKKEEKNNNNNNKSNGGVAERLMCKTNYLRFAGWMTSNPSEALSRCFLVQETLHSLLRTR
jgi:hypothetical protein